MATVELAVVTTWPRQRIEAGDLDINYTVRIHLPFVPADKSIASFLWHPANCYVLFWQQERRSYGKIDLARPISTLTSPSMQSLPGPLLLLTCLPTTFDDQRRLASENIPYTRSDDVHLLPSSHTGDTPPQLPFLQRIRNAVAITPTTLSVLRPTRTPRSSPTLIASDPFASEQVIDMFDEDDLLLYENELVADTMVDGLNMLLHDVGISFDTTANTTTWNVVLHREDKETVFLHFFHQFCDQLKLTSGTLPPSASCMKIHMMYVGETGVGDGLVVEMLSYIWKYLIEETHHFICADSGNAKGYYIPSDHPDTCLLMGHLGLFAALSISYSVFPHDLHPMFFRRSDKNDDCKNDALLYDSDKCGFIPSNYEMFDADRKDLVQFWHDEHNFDKRVMPLDRVTSEVVFQQLIQPEMYKFIIFPTALGKRNLDTFRHYLFEYAEQEMNGVSVAMVEQAAANVYSHLNSDDLIAMFHLRPEDQRDYSTITTFETFRNILASYPKTRIRQLMTYVTNKAYPAPILVRFGEKIYISTCWSILQLRHRGEKEMAEDLNIILAHDLPNMPYHEQD